MASLRGVAGSVTRLFERLHWPLRTGGAPRLRALTEALERGVHSLRLRDAVYGVEPLTARGEALDRHAELYGLSRAPGEGDQALLARLLARGVTGQMHTTEAALARAIESATGLRPTFRSSRERVAVLDDLEAMADGDRMLDFGALEDGVEFFENSPEATRGFRGRGPIRPGWGPGGLIIELPTFRTPEREDAVLAALRDNIPASLGFDLAWARDVLVQWEERVGVTDRAVRRYDAREIGLWTETPTGFVEEDFAATGWGVDGWTENFGGLPVRPRRRPGAGG